MLKSLTSGVKTEISVDNLSYVLSYWKALYPDELIPLRKDNNVCSKCYFLRRALSKSSQSVSIDTDLEALIKKHSTRKEIHVLDQCVIYVAKKFLKNEPVLLPTVLDLYATNVEPQSDSETDDDNNPKKCSRWLLSSLTKYLSDHLAFHRLPSRKLGIMLYGKGSDIFSSLHYLMYQSRLKSKNETEGLHNLSMSFTE